MDVMQERDEVDDADEKTIVISSSLLSSLQENG